MMILCGALRNASAGTMLRALALLIICVLLSSHGAMTLAAPHGLNGVKGHIHELGPDAGHDAGTDVVADAADDQDLDREGAHMHQVADEAPQGTALLVRLKVADMRDPPTPDSPLVPTRLAPLLEPPSA